MWLTERGQGIKQRAIKLWSNGHVYIKELGALRERIGGMLKEGSDFNEQTVD